MDSYKNLSIFLCIFLIYNVCSEYYEKETEDCSFHGLYCNSECNVMECDGKIGTLLFNCTDEYGSGAKCNLKVANLIKCVMPNEIGLVGTCGSSSDLELVVICPTDRNTEVKIPHPTDCTKYIACNGGNPSLESCEKYTSYDPETEECTLDSQSCEHSFIPNCEKSILLLKRPLEVNPNIYWICLHDKENGYYMRLQACKEGMIFDVNKKECVR